MLNLVQLDTFPELVYSGTRSSFFILSLGELAQLARALDLHSRGHRFDSDILHFFCFFNKKSIFDMMRTHKYNQIIKLILVVRAK